MRDRHACAAVWWRRSLNRSNCFHPRVVMACFRFMELAEIGRCHASLPPPQTRLCGLLGSIGMAVAVFWGCPRCGNMRALRGVRGRCGAQQTNRGVRMAPGCILSVGFRRKSTRALLPMRSLRFRRSGRIHHQGTRRSQIARAPPHRVRTRCACSNQSDRNNTPHTAGAVSGRFAIPPGTQSGRVELGCSTTRHGRSFCWISCCVKTSTTTGQLKPRRDRITPGRRATSHVLGFGSETMPKRPI